MYTDPTGNFSLMETSVAQGIQATINTIITPGFSLQKMLTLANLAVTAYDVATTMRMVFCGEATVLDVALCIVKGLVVQSLISCVSTAVFGEAAAFMLKLVGIGQDTYGLIEAIKSKDPKEIVIATVRLAVSVFTLKSQCFAGDTLVSTEEGNRRIDEIKPGDKVLSYNTETGENELQEVKNVSVSKTDILVHIITDDGRDIETTMFHPFYVKNEDGTGEWKAASNLKAGDELLSEDGNKVKVSEVKVEKLAEEITVYNLELDEVHTYYVAGGVLVHNGCGKSNTNDSESGTDTSRRTALNNIKQDLGLNANESPVSQNMVMLRNANGDPIIYNGQIIYSREMTYDVRGKGIKNEHNEIIDYVVVQDHSYGHTYTNGVGNQSSHFNVRPITNTQNGKVSGMKGHYYFKSKYTWE